MGNVSAPFGFRPVRHLNGMSWNGHTERCFVHADYGAALYIGDPVLISATTAVRDPTGWHLTVEIAADGNAGFISGVVCSVEPTSGSLDMIYKPASTEAYVNVCIDPKVIFHIQDNGLATPDKNMIGANAVCDDGTGSTTTGLSGWMLDVSSDPPAADASNQLTILKVANFPDNTLAKYAIWEVLINLHTLKSTGDVDGAKGVLGA
jgi:hypothetical protein